MHNNVRRAAGYDREEETAELERKRREKQTRPVRNGQEQLLIHVATVKIMSSNRRDAVRG